MKLQYIKLSNQYRSLEPFEQSFPKLVLLKDRVDPIGLVGLNGSGKSNFLELIADIFFELEVYFLHTLKLYKEDSPKYFAFANNKTKEPIYFEIKYKISLKGKEHEIQVIRNKENKNEPKFFIKKIIENDLFPYEAYTPLAVETARKFLPLVVAYTSGLNDLLTLPFVDLQDYYAQQVAKEAKNKSNEEIPSPNLLLLNYDSNAAIVVSNFLLASDKKINAFKENTRIERMNSFRIHIRLNKLYGNKKVETTAELKGYINKLRDCASVYNITEDEKKGDTYTFDFIVNEATKSIFKEKFKTPQKLFDALTKLNLLNTLCIQKTYRGILRKKREKGQLLKFPQIASLDKIFSIEKIELVITHPRVRTEYEKISDGEHQFIHIIGGILLFDEKNADRDFLYLFDEPDTHFNPLWRSTFFYQLHQVLDNKNVEFLLTTHSPFILSDVHGYNVFHFQREGDVVTFKRVQKETYGATFANVIDDVFHTTGEAEKHFKSQISKQSFNDLINILNDIDAVKTLKEWINTSKSIEKRIKLLGESTEKIYLLQAYANKEAQLAIQE